MEYQKALHVGNSDFDGYAKKEEYERLMELDDGMYLIPAGTWSVWRRFSILWDNMSEEEFSERYTLECNVPEHATHAQKRLRALPTWDEYLIECERISEVKQ